MYQVLARKYRPRNFSQLVGQNHVAKALTSALERGRLHHAYLFTGTRGVGKTTIARILAKCLNCETGVTATPCETCTVCTAVNEGRFIDLIEIDAASRTGVDDTRELLNNVPYAPTQGRYKVYLIDEVHMFSNSSFNALLKTLEEPPEHVKFLFATTDPQKLPVTVISRCLQFTLRPLAKDEIYQHLDQVLMSESIPHEAEGLWQLAESAQGSLRDALSLTDQAIAYGDGQVLASDVKDMLGLIDKGLVLDLLINIHQNQRQAVAQLLVEMRQQAIDVTHVLEQLISTMHDMALLQCLGTVVQDQEQFEQRKAQIAQMIAPQDLQLYYQIALQGRADLALSLTAEQGFEMCVMRLLAFRPLSQNEVLVQATPQTVAVQAPVQAVVQQPIAVNESNAQVAYQYEVTTHVEHGQDRDLHLEQSNSYVLETAQPEILAVDVSLEDQQNQQIVAELTEPTSLELPAVESSAPMTPNEDMLFQADPTIEALADVLPENEGPVALDEAMVQEVLSQPEMISNDPNVMLSNDMILAVKHPLESEGEESIASPESENHTLQNIPDDPRELLNPEVQELTGEWNLLKWDYWLRQDALSPAVKEIAQHGIMQGQIDGDSTLSLDESYQRMFDGFIADVETALQQLHPQLRLKVQYQNIAQDSPFELQQQRKRDAYQKAQHKVSTHPVIEDLMQEFNAKIEEFNLKP